MRIVLVFSLLCFAFRIALHSARACEAGGQKAVSGQNAGEHDKKWKEKWSCQLEMQIIRACSGDGRTGKLQHGNQENYPKFGGGEKMESGAQE
jgi:hypothetical protein